MEKQIKKVIEQFNASWLNNDLAALKSILHEDVMFMAPDMKSGLKGRDACLGTVEAYISQAQTRRFEMKVDTMHIIDRSAWLILSYTIAYELKGKLYEEEGVEIWGMICQKKKWLLTWRCLVRNEKLM